MFQFSSLQGQQSSSSSLVLSCQPVHISLPRFLEVFEPLLVGFTLAVLFDLSHSFTSCAYQVFKLRPRKDYFCVFISRVCVRDRGRKRWGVSVEGWVRVKLCAWVSEREGSLTCLNVFVENFISFAKTLFLLLHKMRASWDEIELY